MWFTLGFATAVAIACYLSLAVWVLLISAAVFLAGYGILRFTGKDLCKLFARICLGLSIGFLWFSVFDGTYLSGLKAYDGRERTIEMEVSDYSFETQYGCAVDGNIHLSGRSCKVRMYYRGSALLNPGDLVRCRAELRYTPAGGERNTTYHKGEGIFLLAYTTDTMEITKAEKIPVRYYPACWRKIISERIRELFPGETEAFATALLLGDDTGILFQDDIAFQRSGIRHVIAVSGLHVAILFSILHFFTGRRKYLTLVTGLPLLLLFAAVAGFSPSVVRACIMQALVLVAIAADREYDPATALSFAALVLLCVNPLTITSVSFQLSVGSMIGIFTFSTRILDYLKNEKRLGSMKGKTVKARLKRWFAGSVSVSVSAMSLTLPLCALYFGMVSVVGILTNLLTLWVVSFIFCGIILACVVSVIWLPLGTAVAWVISVPIRYVLLCARLLSALPFGVAYTDSIYTVLWVIFSVLLVLCFLIWKRKSPLLLTAGILLLYSISLLATWAEPRLDSIRLTVLDVGQGQCVLLQSKENAYMIDCGGKDGEQTAELALCALGAQGITELDGLILTHYDEDHANGAEYLTQVFPIKKLYLPDIDRTNSLRRQLSKTDIPIQWINKERSVFCGRGVLTLYPSENEINGNESSLCILFRGEKCDILITGDRNIAGERELLERADIPKLEILVAGHHGAATSSGLELLRETTPETVIFSVGKNNLHGHPAPETLERLSRFGCRVLRTDIDGKIIIRV